MATYIHIVKLHWQLRDFVILDCTWYLDSFMH
jgi:hypothetical protein